MPAHVPRLYHDAELAVGGRPVITGDQAHHLLRVLKLKPGDSAILFNGQGGEYEATVTATTRGDCSFEVTAHDPVDRESPLAIHLGLAVLKRDAMIAALQRAVELGVTRITPVVTSHVAVSAKQQAGRRRQWQDVVRMAAEQSGRTRVPGIAESVGTEGFLRTAGTDVRLIAHPGPANTWPRGPASEVTLLVGPEGGLAEEEIRAASATGWQTVSAGPRILRAETTPAALLAMIQQRWGDM